MCLYSAKSIWDNPGPDKGWSWVVAFGLWITGFPAYGIFGCLGVIYPAVQETLQISLEEASWPFFLASVTGNLVGIVLPVVTRIMTIRQLLTSSLSLFVSGAVVCFVAPRSILVLSIFYGIPYGIFHGFFMHSSFLVVAQYFEKYRASALAVLLTAPAIAMFTLPLLIQYLLSVYEYRGALLVVAAFAAQSLPAIFLLRPRNATQFNFNDRVAETPEIPRSQIVIRKMDLVKISEERKSMLAIQEVRCPENDTTETTAMLKNPESGNNPVVSFKRSSGDVTLKSNGAKGNNPVAATNSGPVKLTNLKSDLIRTLKRPECILVVFPDAAIMTAYIFCYVLMVAHAVQCGLSQNVVSMAFLAFGISALIFRLSFATMIDRNYVRKGILIKFSFLSQLINCLLYTLWNTRETYIICAVLFSFSISSYQSLRLSHMTIHFHQRDIPILLSFSSIFSSCISLVTPKLIGLSISMSGDYRPLWIFVSLLLVVSILCLFIESVLQKKIEDRNIKRNLHSYAS